MLSQLYHLWSLANEYWQWLLGIAGLSAILSWIPGGGAAIGILTSALQFAASAFQSIAPIINGVLSAIIWIWSNIIWPGLLHILESWATIFTVLIMGGTLWFGLITDYKVKTISLQHRLNVCLSEIKQSGNKVPEQEPEPQSELPWPFNWK